MGRGGAPARTQRAAAVCVAAVLVIDLWVAVRHPSLHGDSAGLVVGAQKIVDCLHHGVFTHCDSWTGGRVGPSGGVARVGPWPLLQYLPAVVLRALGLSHDGTLRVLIVVNALALWAVFGLALFTLRRTAAVAWAPVLVVALIASPLLWYGIASFGEASGAAIVAGAIAAALLRARPALVGALVALASLTKETNPLFVFALVAVCVLATSASRPEKRTESRHLLVGAAIGALAGGVANAAFNVLRFGSVRNTIYLQSYEQAPNRAVAARGFGALWFAPNGGIVWFWPGAIAIIGLTCAGAMWTLRRTRPTWSIVAPLLVAGVLLVEVVGLSDWYSPFGWVAWGPRLVLTLLPAMMLIACVFASDRATNLLHRIMGGPLLWVAAVVTIAIGLPEVTVLFQPKVINQFFAADPHCVNAHVGQNPGAYYRCFDYTAWRKRPLLLQRGLGGLGSIGGWVVSFAFVGAVVALLMVARANARDARDRKPSSLSAT